MAEESSGTGYMPVPLIMEVSQTVAGSDRPRSEINSTDYPHNHEGSHGLPGDGELSDCLVHEASPLRMEVSDNSLSTTGPSSRHNHHQGDAGSERNKPSPTPEGGAVEHHNSQQMHSDTEQQQQQQTEAESEEDLLFPGFVPKTFYILTQTNFVRFWCLRCITWPWFERISMFVIILNCITLGMYQPCKDESCTTIRCRVLEAFDHFIFAFFAVEMLIKMLAMGVIGKETYLADSWNRLDCFIVMAGTIEYAIETENLSLSAIRTIRVLRPLRAINRIPSMRILVMLLLDTLPMLGNVLLLCFFVFFIFGIIGVQLWSGVLRHRCFLELNDTIGFPTDVPDYYIAKSKVEFICSPREDSGIQKCEGLPPFEYEGIKCNASAKMYSNNTPTNESCVNWNQYYTNCTPHAMNPFMGSVSFDNIGLAWVVIFQVISLESWVNIMYYVQDAHSFWDWVYFVALIVIGSFFMINLCLVVIATQFSETKKRETERMLQERKRFQSCSTLASNSEPGGCYTELLKLIAQGYRRLTRKLIKAYYKTRGVRKLNPEKTLSLRGKKNHKKGTNRLVSHRHCSSHPPPVHHHQHQHLLLAPSPQPLQQQQCSHHINLATPDIRYQSPPRPSSIAQAPRASPEQSDIDSMSSPRRPNYLVLPSGNYSLNPSWDSLATSNLSVDPFSPALLKSQNSSTNQLSANFGYALSLPLSRAHSCHSGANTGGRMVPSLPEVLAAQGAKNAALVASNMLLNVEYEASKTQSVADKGLFADNLLMDMVGDKQLATQLSTQSDGDGHHPGPGCTDQEVCSCAGSADIGQKEFSGEHGTTHAVCAPSVVIVAGGDTVDSELDASKEESGETSRTRLIKLMQKNMTVIVERNFFQRSILIAILLNTLSMGVEFHLQPDWLTSLLEYSNIVFCVLFGCEMSFKLCAYGLFGYISSGFNVFDGFIVILSIVELAQGGASGLSVLRTFRLLRILKLVRFMPALRRQLVVMLRTMDNVATFFALLVLFMFIFSILGMSLFGGAFCEKDDGGPCSCRDRLNASIVCHCDRANFDNLIWSLVTVFQVLTQEDWNTVLYNGMAKTSAWASLYFIALMTFGNYVLFNLLVAILVEGFSTEDEEKKKEKIKEIDDEEKDEDEYEDEEEKEKQRLAENNNIDDTQSTKSRLNSLDLDVKNNQEKEKKMLALPPATYSTIKPESMSHLQAVTSTEGPLNPPIITHTAATPMATPQGSPNENAVKDTNHKLSVSTKRSALKSTLSVDSDRPSVIYRGGSPRPPSIIRGNNRGNYHQRSASWRLRDRRHRGDKMNLVVDSLSDSPDDVDDDVFSSSHSQSPTYSAGTPRTPSVNTHGDCNGHPPLNNQRAFSPQNSLKGRSLTPHNSFKSQHSWSRNNSVGSRRSRNNSVGSRSLCNSFELSRQNSFTSHRTINSLGSGNSKDENKSNKNFVDMPDVKIALDKEEGREEDVDDLADPDAIDETDWNCAWCPEPRGCFLTRHEYAFYILSNENRVRKFAQHLISRAWFDNAVLFFIALNCITLAMERPDIPPESLERTFLTYSNYIFTFVFTIEMMLKVVAKGFFVGKHAYLKSGWNVMDGFLVIISLIDIFISLSASSSPRIFGILRVFRLLRTLRPLRVISRAPGLKLVVQTLLSSLRPIGNIVLICCTFFIIFGILGVQLFKGTFYYCKGPVVSHIVNRTHCLADRKNHWVNQKYNFDNLGQALMALFVLASKDGWVQIMYTGLDAVGVDQQPKENFNEWRLIYFISFLLLVAFFVLNMFVGVVVENFHKCRESQEIEERAKRAAKRQEKLDKKRKKMREPPYWANYCHGRLLIHTVINSKYFDLAIAVVIGFNVITMAMEYHMMPEELEFALKIFNFFFTSVFILEAIMKIVALGFYKYIKDRWNQLDIMIVIMSIVGIVLEEMRTNVIPINPTIIRVMRVLRIARVLKLLKMAKGIRALLDTVIQALPQVGNLGLLFFLLFFIFAALGVELFGRLECSTEHPCEGLGIHAHFHNFGMAFLTLFRVATGDNWNGIMKDTLREDCDRSDNCLTNCCVSPLIAPVYFVVFVLMAQFVLVNVVVAVLMKHLEETYKYKELDDELEEELRAEMCALALAGKTAPIDSQTKESHRMMDDDAVLLRETIINAGSNRQDVENKDNDMGKEIQTGLANTAPSFSFCVRPPSEEQSRSEDVAGPSPVNASVTMEGLASSWSSMDSNRLAVTPSMTGSSLSSDHSVRISSPPIRRAASPYLLSLQGQSGSLQRRPLVKQYSMDVGSDPQLNNIHTSTHTDMWEKLTELHTPQCKPDQNISRSQPSLKDIKGSSLEGKAAGSLDSKESSTTGERLPARDRIKHKLLRSRSSGAKYSRFRDKYKQSNLNKVLKLNGSETSLSKEKLKKSSQHGSNETGSDVDESILSDWGSEEAACDLEVKMITGGTEDDEDDVRPTLSPCASEDRESGHLETCVRGLMESVASGSQSSRGDSTPRAMKPAHTKGRNPLPAAARTNPGIDNTSFELGEDIRLPPCCKARESAAVKRSNSFSPSKLTPKAFSPPMLLSPRSDRSVSPFGLREHTTAVSPLAMEDSAYKLSLSHTGRDAPLSPVSFAHTHMLTVPYAHSAYSSMHMRSPSPTPPKHGLLAQAADHPHDSRWQPVGSPAPVRRQQTLSRSSAVDHDSPVTTSPLRRRIPHTLSMDSAFLLPPGLHATFSMNEPYLELHAGCRAASPLPSPRNSQQTLPSMFTRSASTSAPQQWHTSSQPRVRHQQSLPSHPATDAVTISHSSAQASSCSQSMSIAVPSLNPTDSDPCEYEDNLVTPTQEVGIDTESSGAPQQLKDDNSDRSEAKF